MVKKYSDVRDALNTQYSEFHATHEKTPKQEANWVEFDGYKAMVDGLREKTDVFLKEKEWSLQTRREFQVYLLPLMFTVLPLRNEFVMTVVSKSAFNKLTPAENEKGNYFVAPQKDVSSHQPIQDIEAVRREDHRVGGSGAGRLAESVVEAPPGGHDLAVLRTRRDG